MGDPAEELAADEVAAENKKEVYSSPSEAAYLIQVGRVSEDAVMINENKDDREGAQVVQAGKAARGTSCLQRKFGI